MYQEKQVVEAMCLGNMVPLIDLCKATDLKIMNGRLFNDREIGACTCIKGEGSLVDYLLCCANLINCSSIWTPMLGAICLQKSIEKLAQKTCPKNVIL